MYKRLVPPVAAAILIMAAACVPIGKNNEEAKGAVMLHADRKYDVGIEAGMISGGPAEQNEKQEGSLSEHTDSGEAVLLTLSDVMAMADDPQAVEAERAFYKGTLFIGDSRTVGMRQYSGMDTAEYFCATGMSSFNVMTEKADTSLGKVDLPTLLSKASFDRIFIMLGINELGYNRTKIAEKLVEVVARVRELQPKAAIYLEANMHVTSARSQKDAIYNNVNLNEINAVIKGIADENGLAYIDVNPLFDDADGSLNAEYTFDHTHVLGKYYKAWSMWLYKQCS